ncbi:MAG TPA: ATP-binding cassette domain-containing protein [Rhodanobacteraceae bacterium]
MATPNVRMEHVTKRFSGHTAVDDMSIEVPSGGIFGLLGPNGAGKSTAIRLIMGILMPDAGKVDLFSTGKHGRHLSERVGYLPEERGLYKKMPVLDHLIFLGQTRGLSRADGRRQGQAWLERLGVADWADKKVEDLSKGMQQKVQFAGAMLHDPELLILDEPFSGLDPVNAQVMKDTVVELAHKGHTIIFSTHVMEQAERMCDRIVIMAKGRKVVDGPLAQVKAESGKRHVALDFSGSRELASGVLADRSLVASVDDFGASAEIELASGADPGRLLSALVACGTGLSRFQVVEPSLQSIFIAKVGAEAAHAARVEVAA